MCIQKFDRDGNFISKFGTEGNGDGQFSHPIGVVADSFGCIYVADLQNHRIQKFDNEGNFISKWGTLGNDNGQFNSPEI
jgi:tripartite motif-containing protein 71